MIRFIVAGLLALPGGEDLAHADIVSGRYTGSPAAVISHTGPRYCPDLADTGHPFAVTCPSWPQPSRNMTAAGSVDVQPQEGTQATGAGTASEDTDKPRASPRYIFFHTGS